MKYENNKIVYEVGDWVTALESSLGFEKGETSQVIPSKGDCSSIVLKIDMNKYNGFRSDGVAYPAAWIRPATQAEIDQAIKSALSKKITIPVRPTSCAIELTKEEYLKIGKDAKWI